MRLHNLQVIGRIGQDAKIIDHQGRRFLAFSLAVDESYKDAQGTKIERTTWYDCTTEQERFLKVINWLTKGRELLVEGKPSVRVYEKEGKHYGAMKIQVQNLSFGQAPNDERPAASAPAAPARPVAAPARPAATTARPAATTELPGFLDSDENNDLPF